MEKKSRTPTSETSRRTRAVQDGEQSQDEYNSLDEGEVRGDAVASTSRTDSRQERPHDPLMDLYEQRGSRDQQYDSQEEARPAATRPKSLQVFDSAARGALSYMHKPGESRFAYMQHRNQEPTDEESSEFHSLPPSWQEPAEQEETVNVQTTPDGDQLESLDRESLLDLVQHLRAIRREDAARSQTRATPGSDSETNYESAVETTAATKSARRRVKKKIQFQLNRPEDKRQGGGDAGSHKPKGRTPRFIAEPAVADQSHESSDEEPEPEALPVQKEPNHHRPRKGSAVPFRTFDGTRWAAFKRQFDSACIANKIPEEERGARLECALVGEATDVLGEEAQSYDKLVETLHARYGETKAKKEVLLELMQMKREPTETVLVFADRMKRVARSGGLKPDANVESLYMAFINGMSDYSDTLTAVCKKCKTKSLDEAVRVASRYEMIHGRTPTTLQEAVKTSWGLVAAANSYDRKDHNHNTRSSAAATAVDQSSDGTIIDRIVKLERETEKITTLTNVFKEDVQATRAETKEVSENLLKLKTRYDENEQNRLEAIRRRNDRDRERREGPRRDNRQGNGNNNNNQREAFGHGRTNPGPNRQA